MMKQPVSSVLCLLCLCFLLLPYTAYAKTEEEYQQDIRALQKRNTQTEKSVKTDPQIGQNEINYWLKKFSRDD